MSVENPGTFTRLWVPPSSSRIGKGTPDINGWRDWALRAGRKAIADGWKPPPYAKVIFTPLARVDHRSHWIAGLSYVRLWDQVLTGLVGAGCLRDRQASIPCIEIRRFQVIGVDGLTVEIVEAPAGFEPLI